MVMEKVMESQTRKSTNSDKICTFPYDKSPFSSLDVWLFWV